MRISDSLILVVSISSNTLCILIQLVCVIVCAFSEWNRVKVINVWVVIQMSVLSSQGICIAGIDVGFSGIVPFPMSPMSAILQNHSPRNPSARYPRTNSVMSLSDAS